MSITERIASASKNGYIQYEVIIFKGVKMLIIHNRLKASINITWELTHDPDVGRLAEEMGIKLRRFR